LASSPRRIILAAIGSLGDLHPYLAIALGLRQRGHDVAIATSTCYREKIESLGLPFHPIRPNSDFLNDPTRVGRYMHPRWGTVHIGVELIGPNFRNTYDDLLDASTGADLLVTHPLVAYSARLVSERHGIPWLSTMITPLGFLSAYDVPIVTVVPTLCHALRLLGPGVAVPLLWLNKRLTRFLASDWYKLRAELALPKARDANPLLDSHSPRLVLGLWSKHFADKQPDWPPQTILTGFPLYDRHGADQLPPELTAFLDAGPPPIVFTLGYSAAVVAGRFFDASVEAAMRLNRRAVLITGREMPASFPPLPPGIVRFDYAPYSQLFPRAAAVVHAGGIGTCGLVMRAGVPSLVVPFAHDQPDNAARLTRLGVARILPPRRYNAARAARALQALIEDPKYRERIGPLATQVQQEDGTRAACDAIDGLLNA
jgi:UDP:flavonoid glycosyltransferase YjiC (YdhE family)